MSEDIENSIYKANIPKDSISNKLLDCTDFKCTAALNIYYAD